MSGLAQSILLADSDCRFFSILTKPVLEKSLKGMLTLAGQRQRARMGEPAPTEPESKS